MEHDWDESNRNINKQMKKMCCDGFDNYLHPNLGPLM